jgi:hypothetical protein
MTTKKLKPLKVDVVFLDPVTMVKICSLNECIEKFTLSGTTQETSYPKWLHGKPLIKDCHYRECVECHRRYKAREDKRKNIESFYESVTKVN